MSLPIAIWVSMLSLRAEENRSSVEVALKNRSRLTHLAGVREARRFGIRPNRSGRRGPNS